MITPIPTTAARPAPPAPSLVRAALATKRAVPSVCVLQLSEANRAARALGSCIGCVQGTTFAVGLTDPHTDEVSCLAVCATPGDSRFADPHTLELRCVLMGAGTEDDVRRLLRGLERMMSERGYRRLVRRMPVGAPPSPDITGWARAAGCGWRHCDGRPGVGAVWAKVLRGDLH